MDHPIRLIAVGVNPGPIFLVAQLQFLPWGTGLSNQPFRPINRPVQLLF